MWVMWGALLSPSRLSMDAFVDYVFEGWWCLEALRAFFGVWDLFALLHGTMGHLMHLLCLYMIRRKGFVSR